MATLRPTWQDSPLNQVNGQLGQDWLADLEAAGVNLTSSPDFSPGRRSSHR